MRLRDALPRLVLEVGVKVEAAKVHFRERNLGKTGETSLEVSLLNITKQGTVG